MDLKNATLVVSKFEDKRILLGIVERGDKIFYPLATFKNEDSARVFLQVLKEIEKHGITASKK